MANNTPDSAKQNPATFVDVGSLADLSDEYYFIGSDRLSPKSIASLGAFVKAMVETGTMPKAGIEIHPPFVTANGEEVFSLSDMSLEARKNPNTGLEEHRVMVQQPRFES